MPALAQQTADDFAAPPPIQPGKLSSGKKVAWETWNKQKQECDQLRIENARLRKLNDELAQRSILQDTIPRPVDPIEFSEELVTKRLIPELQSMADQGATLPECLAAWNVSEAEWAAWCASTPLLQAEALRARTRARAVFESIFRKALASGDRAFPFAKWVDIMDQRYGTEDKEAKGNANDVQSKGGRCEVCRDIILED